MNILVFSFMIPVYFYFGMSKLMHFCVFSVIILSGTLCFRNVIPEIVSLFIMLLNLDVYALLFSILTGSGAGAELYPLVLTGISYLLTYDMKKPKFLCPCFALISAVICLYISLFYRWNVEKTLLYPINLYHIHNILSTVIVIAGFTILSITYEKVLNSKNLKEKKQREELIYIANHDPLTSLMNRRRIWEHLHSCENQKYEMGTNYVISIFDIDYFKRVNDTYGHACGDFVLVEISKLIKENLPKNVKIGRWGGEEFLLLFKAYSDEKAIEEIEKLRKLIDETIFDFLGTKIHITLTFGVSSSSYCDSAEHIIIDADKQLMKGKIQGKNRVVARSLQKSLSENDTLFDSIIDTNHKE